MCLWRTCSHLQQEGESVKPSCSFSVYTVRVPLDLRSSLDPSCSENPLSSVQVRCLDFFQHICDCRMFRLGKLVVWRSVQSYSQGELSDISTDQTESAASLVKCLCLQHSNWPWKLQSPRTLQPGNYSKLNVFLLVTKMNTNNNPAKKVLLFLSNTSGKNGSLMRLSHSTQKHRISQWWSQHSDNKAHFIYVFIHSFIMFYLLTF